MTIEDMYICYIYNESSSLSLAFVMLLASTMNLCLISPFVRLLSLLGTLDSVILLRDLELNLYSHVNLLVFI